MKQPHLLVIGGGLAGLSAGCYALRSGFRVTLVEHNLALGGVCTAWQRGPYTIDGCIHWLTGGPFSRVYQELGILDRVRVRPLREYVRYRRPGHDPIPVEADLDALRARLRSIAPEDAGEIDRIITGAREFVALTPPLDAPELTPLREHFRRIWEGRGALGALMHFRKPMATWARDHLQSDALRRLVQNLVPPEAPAVFLLMILGYLEKGYLSRPEGGTAAFRAAVEDCYRSGGGEVLMPRTVDEILVEEQGGGAAACGVRMADGTLLSSDYVLSTASAPETVLRLLGGRYDADTTRERLAHWKLFDPIVLASFGVETPLDAEAGLQVIDDIPPLSVGGRPIDSLYVRVCNDDGSFAPPGHCVIQAMLKTNYDWWATRGSAYGSAKDETAQVILSALEPHFPALRGAVRVIDLATPLTYWSMARSWRGAFEGWIPSPEAFFTHPRKTLHGLKRFVMAGQWVEPGGGVPTAVLSGRQAIQLLCDEAGMKFVAQTNA